MPALREDFTTVTELSTFPAKFVACRCVENERAIEILPSLKKYVKSVAIVCYFCSLASMYFTGVL